MAAYVASTTVVGCELKNDVHLFCRLFGQTECHAGHLRRIPARFERPAGSPACRWTGRPQLGLWQRPNQQ